MRFSRHLSALFHDHSQPRLSLFPSCSNHSCRTVDVSRDGGKELLGRTYPTVVPSPSYFFLPSSVSITTQPCFLESVQWHSVEWFIDSKYQHHQEGRRQHRRRHHHRHQHPQHQQPAGKRNTMPRGRKRTRNGCGRRKGGAKKGKAGEMHESKRLPAVRGK